MKKSLDKIHIFSPEKVFCYAQPTGLILVNFSKSFDISLTFAILSDTLFHNKAALLNESYYITLFVRSAASPNHFAAIHPRQNLLVPRSLFLFERLAAGQPVRNSLYVPWQPHQPSGLDTAPWPRRNAGEPDNAAAKQGQELNSDVNGDPTKQETLCTSYFDRLETVLKWKFSKWREK